MENDFNYKRIHPPIWQHDYHVLRKLYRVISYFIDKYIHGKVDAIVDYGCGTSPYKNLFLSQTEKYIGIDLPENREADIKIKKNEKIPLKDSSINVIVSTQVLEHIDDVDLYLRECRRLVKKNGFLLLSTHGVWPYHEFPHDYHRWTRAGLKNILISNGFNCLEIVSVLGPFASATQYTLVLIAEKLHSKGFFARIMLFAFSIIGNMIIWFENQLFPPTKESDASLYVVCAQRI